VSAPAPGDAPRPRDDGPLAAGGLRWWLGPGVAPERAKPALEAALAALAAGAEDRKRGRRKSLYRLDLGGTGEPDHLLKVNRYAGRRRRSKARHELAVAAALSARGLPAPVPLAAGERRRGGRLEACYLLVPILPGVRDLREDLARGPAPRERRALARALGDLARRLHDAGLHQDDFQPNNFLVRWRGDRPELFVIDFERARLRRRVPERLRRRALAKLEREAGRAPASRRLRFLHAYCGGDARAARRWWRGLQAEAAALARRDAAHLFRNATRPGRRFEAVRLPGHRGVALPGLDRDRLERAARRGSDASAAVVGAPDAADWSVRLDASGVRHARRALARALVLAARGLAPRPLAVLCGERDALLVLERGERTIQAFEARPNAAREAAWRVLERRLDAYGLRIRPLSEAEVAVEPLAPSGVRASLLGIDAFAVRPPWDRLRRHFGARGAPAARSR
jgi:hypothetical protein